MPEQSDEFVQEQNDCDEGTGESSSEFGNNMMSRVRGERDQIRLLKTRKSMIIRQEEIHWSASSLGTPVVNTNI